MLSSVKIFDNNFGNYTPTDHPFTLRRSPLEPTDLGLKNNPLSRKCYFRRTEFFTPERQSIVRGEMGLGVMGIGFPSIVAWTCLLSVTIGHNTRRMISPS